MTRRTEPISTFEDEINTHMQNNLETLEANGQENRGGLKHLYFILWTMGENFPSHKSFTNADLQRHESYIRQAYSDGKLLMAALFENGSGFITLIEAETDYEIHKFVRNNPEVIDKKIQARIKPCRPLYWKYYE
jgi:hypothetical protein